MQGIKERKQKPLTPIRRDVQQAITIALGGTVKLEDRKKTHNAALKQIAKVTNISQDG